MTETPVVDKADEILKILETVKNHPETNGHLEEYENQLWLPMDNINNGHKEASEEYKALMSELSDKLNGYLINSKGGHSHIYYNLKKAGYYLRTGESDSFGPLSAVIKCPDADWYVCYG